MYNNPKQMSRKILYGIEFMSGEIIYINGEIIKRIWKEVEIDNKDKHTKVKQ